MNIDLDRTKIDKNDIDGDGKSDGKPLDELFDGVGYEKEPLQKISKKEIKFKKKVIPVSINLHLGNGLRLIERFINKYLGSLVGNNPDPFQSLTWLTASRLNIIYLVAIIILTFFLIIK